MLQSQGWLEERVGNESLAAAGGNEWLRALGILASGPLGQPEGE